MSKYCAVVNGTMVCVPWGDDSDVPATTEERIASAIDSLKHLEKYGKNCDVRFIARGAREELEAIDGNGIST